MSLRGLRKNCDVVYSMIDYQKIIDNYFFPNTLARKVYMKHAREVTKKALEVAKRVPELHSDLEFIEEAAMLHDIGICKVNAPGLGCFGSEPYVKHTVLGKEILEAHGLPKHARVCIHHIGVGISKEHIIAHNIPLPKKDLFPETIEEKIISFADKFFTKMTCRASSLLTHEEIVARLAKHNPDDVVVFEKWCEEFKEPIK